MSAKQPASLARPLLRRSRRMGDSGDGQTYTWLITFTDVMGLLLTFFVLMFAMSETSTPEWTEMQAALSGEFNKFYGPAGQRGTEEGVNIPRLGFVRGLDVRYIKSVLEGVIVENESLHGTQLIVQGGELAISMPADLLFPPGKARVSEEGAQALYVLGGALGRIKNRIEVAGHAEPGLAEKATVWEMSLARAVNVAAILENVGYDRPIRVRGFGAGRYDDLAGIADATRRRDMARRVDIIVTRQGGH